MKILKLLFYEFIKCKKNVFLMALILFLLMLNGIFILNVTESQKAYNADSSEISAVFDIYYSDPQIIQDGYDNYLEIKQLNDEITKESIKSDVQASYIPYEKKFSENPDFPDSYFYEILFSEINKITSYPKTVSSVVNNAEKIITEYNSMEISKDSYAINYQLKAIEKYTYTGSKIRMGLEYVHGWETYFEYQTDNILIFIMVLALSVFTFLNETETGMNSILSISRYGRSHTAITKIVSTLVCITFVVTLFTIEKLLIIGINIGFSNFNNAIQIIDSFYLCPDTLTVIQFFIVCFFQKTLAYFVFSLLIMTFGLLTRSVPYTYISGTLLYALNYVFTIISPDNPNLFIKKINLLTASSVTSMYKNYQAVNLFGNAVDCSSVTFIVLCILALLSIIAIVIIYSGTYCFVKPRIKDIKHSNKITYFHSKIGERKKTGSYCLSLFYWELKKTVGSLVYVLIIFLCVIIKIIQTEAVYSPIYSNSDIIYHDYMTYLSGKISNEKREYISDEREKIDYILSQYSQYRTDYANDVITYSDYSEYLSKYGEAYEKNLPLLRVEERLRYLDDRALDGKNAWFVYEIGWKELFLSDFDWILYLIQLLLISNTFMMEFKSKSSQGTFQSILHTTKNGRKKTFRSKIVLTVIISSVICLIFSMIDVYIIMSHYDLPEWSAPIQSLPFMSEAPFGMSILLFFIIYVIGKLIANVVLALLIASLSSIIRRFIPTLTTIIFVTLVPRLLYESGIKFFSYMDYISVLKFTPLILNYTHSLTFVLLFLLFTVTSTIAARNKWIN